MSVTAASEKISGKTKVLYGVADLGMQAIIATLQFWVLFFYTDVAHINPGLAGTALVVGKLTWDLINDPLVGYLSDKTKSKLGRRRPWMLIGAVPLALSTWFLLSIPEGLMGVKAFLAILISFLLLDTCHTAVSVPYYAMTPELTLDYTERTSLTTVREIFNVLGYITGAGLTKMLADVIQNSFHLTTQQSWSAVGAMFGVVACLTVMTTALTVKERRRAHFTPNTMPPFKAFLTTFKNKPFMILMGAQFLSGISFIVMATFLPYYVIYQVKMESQLTIIMLILLVCIGVFLFPWRAVSEKINKGPSYALGLFIASLAVIASFFFPNEPTPLIFVTVAVAGIGLSGQWVFPWSMLPDVVEYDQAMTGERHEGIYYGMWSFLTKFAGALGIAVCGWVLDIFGYVANQPQQTARALLGIRLFFGPVAAGVLIISLPLLIWYPITRKTHAEILAKIAESQTSGESPE